MVPISIVDFSPPFCGALLWQTLTGQQPSRHGNPRINRIWRWKRFLLMLPHAHPQVRKKYATIIRPQLFSHLPCYYFQKKIKNTSFEAAHLLTAYILAQNHTILELCPEKSEGCEWDGNTHKYKAFSENNFCRHLIIHFHYPSLLFCSSILYIPLIINNHSL